MKYGAQDVNAIYHGSDPIDRIYYGADLVFDSEPSLEPNPTAYIGHTEILLSSATSDQSWNSEANVFSDDLYTAIDGDVVTGFYIYGNGVENPPSLPRLAIYEIEDGVPTNRVGSPTTVSIDEDAAWYSSTVDIPLTEGVTYCVAIDYWDGDEFGFNGTRWSIRYTDGVGLQSRGRSASGGYDGPHRLPDPWLEQTTSVARVSFYAQVN